MDADGEATDRLGRWYRAYIGEPERRLDVYLGFGLFFAGLALGVAGLVLFATERVLGPGRVFWLRELAFALGALGLPTLLVGVSTLLPVDRRTTYAAGGGLAITVAAVAFFVSVYPRYWNVIGGGTDYSLEGVALYAAGMVVVVAATAAALVGYHVERTAGGPAEAAEGSDDPEVTDEQVRADIEEAMNATDISWGGVEQVETHRLRVESPDADLDTSGFEGVEATTVRSEGVDDAVAGLRGLRGGEARTDRGGGTDEQAAALEQLRREKEREPADDGPLTRLLRRLGVQ